MLLMLALPLQALASVPMLACQLAHHAVPEVAAMDDAMVAGCHESGEPMAPEQHDCKHCAACALGSALPAFAEGAGVLPAPRLYVLPPAVAVGGFVPEGPERPPRASLA